MTTSLTGKTAIVTGASRGIGRAIAEALLHEGVRLALLSRSRPPLEAWHIPCDLADTATLPATVAQALDQLGGCDFLINNAGMFLENPVVETALEDWNRLLRVNLTAPFVLSRAVLPRMAAAGSGRIINIASTASTQGYQDQSAYCASKHGLLGFARALALEAKPHHVHVHTLCPGGVDTDLIKGTHLADRLAGQPMIRPSDIAAMVVFLLKQPGNLDLPEIIVRRFGK